MVYKGIIFDLDGTLVNTLRDIADAANSSLKKHQFKSHPVDSYRYFVGDGLKTLVERIIPQHERTSENIYKLMETFKEIYQDSWYKKSFPYHGIESMIDTLWSRGVKLAVFSNKPHHFTRLNIDHFFHDHIFSFVQGQIDEIPKKPDPTGALMIAEQLELDREDLVFIGDTAIDIKTGKSAGMKTIGVTWGFRDQLELEENGADIIVNKPEEIINIVINGE